MKLTLLTALTFCVAWPAAAAEKITKETLTIGGAQNLLSLRSGERRGEAGAAHRYAARLRS